MKKFRKGQNGALMDLYEQAIEELKSLVKSIDENTYKSEFAKGEDLNTIQSIIRHVLTSGYGYANYYRKRFNEHHENNFPLDCNTTQKAIHSLDKLFSYSVTSLEFKWEMTDAEMMNTLIKTSWSIYDLEALWEHAIVHILRHKRQIEKIIMEKF